jgi:hypothetical protein
MNPYLEQEDVWHDFHQRFIAAAADSIGPQVAPNYIVKIDSHAYIHELPANERRLLGRPDIAVSQTHTGGAANPAATQAPVYGRLPLAVDVERQSFLQVFDRQTRQLVTVIELLSPSNKAPGADREQYLGKREDVFRSNANLVEIDLLRGHPRLPVEGLPDCDYYVLVSRPGERPRVGLWPIHLRDPLPPVPIPLRPENSDATLELQFLLHKIFDAAGYAYYLYNSAPQPPLAAEDTEWARELLATTARS